MRSRIIWGFKNEWITVHKLLLRNRHTALMRCRGENTLLSKPAPGMLKGQQVAPIELRTLAHLMVDFNQGLHLVRHYARDRFWPETAPLQKVAYDPKRTFPLKIGRASCRERV